MNLNHHRQKISCFGEEYRSRNRNAIYERSKKCARVKVYNVSDSFQYQRN